MLDLIGDMALLASNGNAGLPIGHVVSSVLCACVWMIVWYVWHDTVVVIVVTWVWCGNVLIVFLTVNVCRLHLRRVTNFMSNLPGRCWRHVARWSIWFLLLCYFLALLEQNCWNGEAPLIKTVWPGWLCEDATIIALTMFFFRYLVRQWIACRIFENGIIVQTMYLQGYCDTACCSTNDTLWCSHYLWSCLDFWKMLWMYGWQDGPVPAVVRKQ